MTEPGFKLRFSIPISISIGAFIIFHWYYNLATDYTRNAALLWTCLFNREDPSPIGLRWRQRVKDEKMQSACSVKGCWKANGNWCYLVFPTSHQNTLDSDPVCFYVYLDTWRAGIWTDLDNHGLPYLNLDCLTAEAETRTRVLGISFGAGWWTGKRGVNEEVQIQPGSLSLWGTILLGTIWGTIQNDSHSCP
jgi:hypothetical protein